MSNSDKLSLKAPINSSDFDFEQFRKEADIFPVKVYSYDKVFVTGSGICFNRFSKLLPGTFMFDIRVKRNQQKIAFLNYLLRKKRVLDQQNIYLVIHNQWSINGYYHWLADSAVRLWSVKSRFKEVTLLLPEKAKTILFIQGTLRLLPELKVEYLADKKVAYVNQLVIPTHLPSWGLLEPNLLKEFSDYVVNKVCTKQYPNEFIYISRKNASRRKIVNEENLIKSLKLLGFQIVCLEETEFSKQVKLFNKAKIIMSIHGAALTNLVFMQQGTNVIEVLKSETESTKMIMEYHKLASVFNVNYFYIPSQLDPEGVIDDSGNLIVDTRYIEVLLKRIINSGQFKESN